MNSKSRLREYKEAFLPSGVLTLVFFGAAVLLTIYFFVSLYTNSLITSEGPNLALATENNILVKIIFFLPWASWIDRVLDFAFWGAIAALFLILIWSLSSVKISFSNHHAIEKFTNFQDSKTHWHESFIVELALKALLIFSILYLVNLLLFRFVPSLSQTVEGAIRQVTSNTLLAVVKNALSVFGALYLVATCIKVYRHIQAN